ncbi:MAG: MFS transporter, partial [Candidatus Fermentibacteria bacterium]|nr:MFS transporter [Candidatus Fermentibacteria bacterium]
MSDTHRSPVITGRGKQLIFILCIACGAFMANLDITILNTALPTIARDFSATPNTVAMVVLLYQIFEAGFLLFFGKLGDIRGFRGIYTSGFAVFTIGSLMCGLSKGMTLLLVARAVQGLGGAMLFSVMMATVSSFLPEGSRGKGIGTVTLAAAVGIALGPPLGGFIATAFNWRWIFLV